MLYHWADWRNAGAYLSILYQNMAYSVGKVTIQGCKGHCLVIKMDLKLFIRWNAKFGLEGGGAKLLIH